MQPLKILNNVQKATLLHALLYEEMPEFLDFLKDNTAQILADRETIKANWKSRFFTADLWLSFADNIQRKLEKYGNNLQFSTKVFAEQLFESHTALYTVQQLINYAETSDVDPKLAQAIDLLFI